MNIDKVPGIGPLAPRPSRSKSQKTIDGQFDNALRKALRSDTLSSIKNDAELKNEERLELIRRRIQTGYYDRPDVISVLAEKLINKGEGQ